MQHHEGLVEAEQLFEGAKIRKLLDRQYGEKIHDRKQHGKNEMGHI